MGKKVSAYTKQVKILLGANSELTAKNKRMQKVINDFKESVANLISNLDHEIYLLNVQPLSNTLLSTQIKDLVNLNVEPVSNALLSTQIKDLVNLEVRTKNCLRGDGIHFVGQLVPLTENKLLRIQHFGPQSLHRLNKILALHNLSLGMSVGDWEPPQEQKK